MYIAILIALICSIPLAAGIFLLREPLLDQIDKVWYPPEEPTAESEETELDEEEARWHELSAETDRILAAHPLPRSDRMSLEQSCKVEAIKSEMMLYEGVA